MVIVLNRLSWLDNKCLFWFSALGLGRCVHALAACTLPFRCSCRRQALICGHYLHLVIRSPAAQPIPTDPLSKSSQPPPFSGEMADRGRDAYMSWIAGLGGGGGRCSRGRLHAVRQIFLRGVAIKKNTPCICGRAYRMEKWAVVAPELVGYSW